MKSKRAKSAKFGDKRKKGRLEISCGYSRGGIQEPWVFVDSLLLICSPSRSNRIPNTCLCDSVVQYLAKNAWDSSLAS